MQSSFQFIQIEEVIALHEAIIEASGGSYGIRDEGGLESALNAAQQRAYYENASLALCAATYAYHLTPHDLSRFCRWQQTRGGRGCVPIHPLK